MRTVRGRGWIPKCHRYCTKVKFKIWQPVATFWTSHYNWEGFFLNSNFSASIHLGGLKSLMYSLHPVVIFPVSVASQWVCSISTAVHIAALDLERGCHLVVINLINVEGGGNTQPKGILNPAENPTRGNTQPRKIQPRENPTQGTLNPREDSTHRKLNPRNTQPKGRLNPGEHSTQGKT